jgi:hypothetical protein
MNYFNECTSLEEVKAKYKELAKQHHPDCGGDTAIMQEINAEYEQACILVLRENNVSEDDYAREMKVSDEYRQVIEKIVNLPNIVIEVIGQWIWVTGLTYPVKDQLKEAGLFFASKKAAWYFRSEEYKGRGSDKSLDDIRDKYGSERVDNSATSTLLQ